MRCILKIKNITTITVVILLLTTLLSIWVNVESSIHYKIVDDLDNESHELISLYNSGELPIRVLKNVESQGQSDDPVKSANLEAAYVNNRDALTNLAQESMNLIANMETHVTEFRKVFDVIVDTKALESKLESSKVAYINFHVR